MKNNIGKNKKTKKKKKTILKKKRKKTCKIKKRKKNVGNRGNYFRFGSVFIKKSNQTKIF